MFKTCPDCTNKSEEYLCPVCHMTGPEIAAARKADQDVAKDKINSK